MVLEQLYACSLSLNFLSLRDNADVYPENWVVLFLLLINGVTLYISEIVNLFSYLCIPYSLQGSSLNWERQLY